ncbi:hypothetical protein E4U54_002186 [Claviceps lovelessii]|nr:hypothetical protein E4U54_002186 [Claviceps lovelessii]
MEEQQANNASNASTPPTELATQSPVSKSGPAPHATSGRSGRAGTTATTATAPSPAAASQPFAAAAPLEEPVAVAPRTKQEDSISDEPGASSSSNGQRPSSTSDGVQSRPHSPLCPLECAR